MGTGNTSVVSTGMRAVDGEDSQRKRATTLERDETVWWKGGTEIHPVLAAVISRLPDLSLLSALADRNLAPLVASPIGVSKGGYIAAYCDITEHQSTANPALMRRLKVNVECLRAATQPAHVHSKHSVLVPRFQR